MLNFVHLPFICTFVALTVSQQNCKPGWTSSGKFCYLLTDEHPFYDGPSQFWASSVCRKQGSHLAAITSEEENDFLKAWLATSINDVTKSVWLDGKDFSRRNKWEWSSIRESVVYTDWADNHGKSGRCLTMSAQFDLSWVPEDCDRTTDMLSLCQQDLCKSPMDCQDKAKDKQDDFIDIDLDIDDDDDDDDDDTLPKIVKSEFVAQQKCKPGWTSDGKSCYLLSDKQLFGESPSQTWAKNICGDKSSHLAIVTSEEENDFLKAWLETSTYDVNASVWLDARNFYWANDFEWESTGEAVVYKDWANNHGKSGNCLAMSSYFNFSWVPEDCRKTTNMLTLCEQELCNQPAECFQGSCYALNCQSRMAKVIEEDSGLYDDDDAPVGCPEGSLARIESKEEDDFIRAFLSKSEDFVQYVWTAGYDKSPYGDPEWKWQGTDKAITDFTDFTDWVPPQKDYGFQINLGDEECIALKRGDNWAWKAIDCNKRYPVLCEGPNPYPSG